MVVKLFPALSFRECRFESDVILNGGQASMTGQEAKTVFESDVILNGGQAMVQADLAEQLFESDVILNGGQASILQPCL